MSFQFCEPSKSSTRLVICPTPFEIAARSLPPADNELVYSWKTKKRESLTGAAESIGFPFFASKKKRRIGAGAAVVDAVGEKEWGEESRPQKEERRQRVFAARHPANQKM